MLRLQRVAPYNALAQAAKWPGGDGMTGIERTYYQAGMQARDDGLACYAPGDLSWCHRHWWMAGWNDRDIQRGGK